jgi:hypothetical protein
MAYPEEKRTIVSLFTDVFAETTELFQAEINLVRSEIRQSVGRVANSGTLIGAGAIGALAALFLLLQAVSPGSSSQACLNNGATQSLASWSLGSRRRFFLRASTISRPRRSCRNVLSSS